MAFRIPNWREFQHYSRRRPPWVKLHHSLLDNLDYHCLQLASKALAPCFWLLASESNDGTVTDDLRVLSFRLRVPETLIAEAVNDLIAHGLLEGKPYDASAVLAGCSQHATPETEESRGETEPPKCPPAPPEDEPAPIPYKEIIEDLNARAGTQFRVCDSTRKMIHARWAEGFRLADFRKVHKVKCLDWKGTESAKYLRPETLYRASKFQGYLNQPRSTARSGALRPLYPSRDFDHEPDDPFRGGNPHG